MANFTAPIHGLIVTTMKLLRSQEFPKLLRRRRFHKTEDKCGTYFTELGRMTC